MYECRSMMNAQSKEISSSLKRRETFFSRGVTMPDRTSGPDAGAGGPRSVPVREEWRFRSAVAL